MTKQPDLSWYVYDACVKYGFCLPSAVQDDLIANPGTSAEAFVERIMRSDDVDPEIHTDSKKALLAHLLKREKWAAFFET